MGQVVRGCAKGCWLMDIEMLGTFSRTFIEVILQLLVGVVDTQLLKCVQLKDLEPAQMMSSSDGGNIGDK